MICQAFSCPIPSSSTIILSNSTIARVGWVSFNWIEASLGNFFQSNFSFLSFAFDLCLRMMSWIVADTSKYYCFNRHEIKKGKVSMKLWDLGGQTRFRESWEKFCRDSDVIIFVVDSYDQSNIDLARAQLHELLQNKSLAGIPLLVLGNKNDLAGSLK